MIPKVSCFQVGFYKSRDFLEMDCPHCGKAHVLLVPDAIEMPFRMVMPCTGKIVEICSLTPASAVDQSDEL